MTNSIFVTLPMPIVEEIFMTSQEWDLLRLKMMLEVEQ